MLHEIWSVVIRARVSPFLNCGLNKGLKKPIYYGDLMIHHLAPSSDQMLSFLMSLSRDLLPIHALEML